MGYRAGHGSRGAVFRLAIALAVAGVLLCFCPGVHAVDAKGGRKASTTSPKHALPPASIFSDKLKSVPSALSDALGVAAGVDSPLKNPWQSMRAMAKLASLALKVQGFDLAAGLFEADEEADEAEAEHEDEVLARAALKRKPQSDVAAWEASGDAASFWSLRRPAPLVIPVDLTIVPLGLPVPLEVVETWLSQLDHRLPHPLLDLENRTGVASPHVSYRYRTTLVEAGPRLKEVVDAVVRTGLRPLGTDKSGRQLLYVNARRLEAVLESYVDALGSVQPHGGYFLFLMDTDALPNSPNGDEDAPPPVYGYRNGLSDGDLDAALENDLVRDRLQRHLMKRARQEAAAALPFRAVRPSHFGHEHREWRAETEKNVAVLPAQEVTAAWAAKLSSPSSLSDMSATEVVDEELGVDGATRAATLADLVRRHHAADSPNGPGRVKSDCLTESWVGHGRIAWLDLAAGPFQWGPTVGGRGVKTRHTFEVAAGMHGATSVAADVRAAEAAPEYELTLARLRGEAEEFGREYQLMEGVHEMSCPDGDKSHRCARLTKRMEAVKEYLAIMLPVLIADDDDVATAQLRDALPKVLPARQALLDLLLLAHRGGQDEAEEVVHDTHQPVLMARLASAVQDFMTHVVTPPSALPVPVSPPWDMDMAIDALAAVQEHEKPTVLTRHVCDSVTRPKAVLSTAITRVAFRLLIVRVQDKFNPVGPEYLDVAQLRSELEQFRFGHQRVTFSVHNIAVNHEPALAMAYASAVRHARVPSLSADGKFTSSERTYVDSATITSQLKMLVASSQHSHDPTVLDVPILLFSVHSPEPVYVDKQHLAWPTCGMVVAVQSQHAAQPGRLSCDGAACVNDLRNPVGPIVSAALQVLGGAVPLHLGVSPEGDILQSWLWAVGPSVQSRLSNSHVVTDFTRDAIHRNQLIQQITASWMMIDAGVRSLQQAKTSALNTEVVNHRVWHMMVELRREAHRGWLATAAHMEVMKFDDAADHGRSMAQYARRFYIDAVVASQLMRREACEREQEAVKVHVEAAASPPSAPVFSAGTVLVALLAIVVVVARAVLGSRKKHVKAHLN